MMPDKNVLLVTTTRSAIRAHMPHMNIAKSKGLLISAEECKLFEDRLSFRPDQEWLVLLDEKAPLSDEEEKSLTSLFNGYVIYWIWHSVSKVITLPHHKFYKQQEHSLSGSIVDLLFHWRNSKSHSKKRYLLNKHFETCRRQALEVYIRTYLNEFSAESLALEGEKFLHGQELTYTEIQLLNRYPDLGKQLASFKEVTIPEQLHYKRIQLAEYFYQTHKSDWN